MSLSVENYYTGIFKEETRHKDPFGMIQELRTKEIICSYLEPNMSVLDVGGADGVYSFYLADNGYRASILDITPRHIELAKKRNSQCEHKLDDIILGDASTYTSDKKFDLIILHGPLYHISDKNERIKMLKNMKNLLNPQGKILGFAINRYAGYFYGVRSGMILNSKYKNLVLNEVNTGVRHRGTTWYYHRPYELEAEFNSADFNVITTKSVTGQLWMVPQVEEYLKDKDKLTEILAITRSIEDELEIGQDLVCIAEIQQ